MSEHEHEWQLEGGRRYYYCECGETGPSIEEMWEEQKTDKARIKAFEGVVEAVKGCAYLHEERDISGNWRCAGCGERIVKERHQESCYVGTLEKALKKLEEV